MNRFYEKNSEIYYFLILSICLVIIPTRLPTWYHLDVTIAESSKNLHCLPFYKDTCLKVIGDIEESEIHVIDSTDAMHNSHLSWVSLCHEPIKEEQR